ncbi:MAG TPA: hypothetical protein PLQ00_14955 [Thermoguttaceae bacterium]|nr:hypothetical protein [Thermoguttaceae bacterium]
MAAALLPTLNCLQRGQVGVLKLYLLLLGVRLVWLSASWLVQGLGGLALAGAIALKLTPALAVSMVLWAQVADLVAQVWRRWQSRAEDKNRKESAPGKTILQTPHFAHIHKLKEPNPSHWPLEESFPTPGEHPSNTCSLDEHASERTFPTSSSIAAPLPPRKMGGDRLVESPLGSNPQGQQWHRVAFAARRFWATGFGMVVGLAMFFFFLPSVIIGWQKNLDHLAYWADLVVSSAGEGFAMEKAIPEGAALNEPPKPIPANYRTVRNQSLANGIFRFAAFVDYLVLGGPDDRQLDYEATAPNRIDSPIYQTIQKSVRGILLVAIVLAGGMLGVLGGRLGQAAAFGLGCVGILAISPVSWGHYFMLLTPGALFVPLWLMDRGQPTAAGWLAATPAALSILHYVLMNPLGRIGLLGLGTAGWLLAACILVLRVSLQHGRRLAMAGSAAQTSVCLGMREKVHPQSLSAPEQTRWK